jgi:long-chain acyl-CoA synthetase
MSDTREPDWLQAEREYEDDREEYGTIPELFETSAEEHLDDEAQLYKGGVYDRSLVSAGVVSEAPTGEFATLSYRTMRDIVRSMAAGFREIGFGYQDRVGLFANTRMEWAQTDFALLGAGCVVTTVYTDSSPSQVKYLLGDPDASGVVVENERLLERVLEVEDELDLSAIVLVDDPETDYDRDDIYTLGEVYEMGAEAFDEATYEAWLDETDPDDLASLIYTSGTTGKPKGVQLTHWNFRSNFHDIRRRIGPRPDDPERIAIDSDSRAISFLPLAHVFERQSGHFLMFGSGASVGYAESPDTISGDIKKLEPTCGGSVPRVYERIFDRMRDQAGGGLSAKIFNWALGVAKQYQMADDPGTILEFKHSIGDRLVYSQIKENLGGNIEIMVSGGGSLSKDLCRMFNGIGLTIVEGYGLTETSPVISVNSPDDIRPGTLGTPVVGVDVAIDEAKDVNEDFEAPDSIIGELLVRGPNVTDGYWNKPGATDRAFVEDPFDEDDSDVTEVQTAPETVTETTDDDGKWFRTGDLVEQTPDGFLVFHERLKQLLVLDTGKNVAPQPLEDAFATNDRIEQIMVVGDGRKFVGALIVPNYERLETWADKNDVELPDSRAAMVNDQAVIDWVSNAVAEVNEGFEKYEQIKKFALAEEEWTPENDLLTPSMKKKRRTILSTYDRRIEEIYNDEE